MLVDTIVWIAWLLDRTSPATDRLARLLDDGEALLALVILQGARDPARRVRRAPDVVLPAVHTYADAGARYARCRWQGYTPRSPHDCLIAQLAIEHRLRLLHDDRNFEHIARVELRLLSWQDEPV